MWFKSYEHFHLLTTGTVESNGGYILEQSVSVRTVPELLIFLGGGGGGGDSQIFRPRLAYQ